MTFLRLEQTMRHEARETRILCRARDTSNTTGFVMTFPGWLCLLLLLKVLPMCHSMWFFSNECACKPFNRHTHICCDDQLHKRPAGWRYVFCCGTLVYNPKTNMCCGNTRIVSTVGMKVYTCLEFYEQERLWRTL
ncbi:hypothetical protein LSAT2_026978 [Lamellibrachia satsuma]|nr:hypothetical protein LSAT2_026978 [Lamellibrachia satsuma]